MKIALGQYEIYKVFLKATAPEHQLYIAISHKVSDELFQQKAYQLVIKEYQIPLLIVNVETEEIIEWTKSPNIAS